MDTEETNLEETVHSILDEDISHIMESVFGEVTYELSDGMNTRMDSR